MFSVVDRVVWVDDAVLRPLCSQAVFRLVVYHDENDTN